MKDEQHYNQHPTNPPPLRSKKPASLSSQGNHHASQAQYQSLSGPQQNPPWKLPSKVASNPAGISSSINSSNKSRLQQLSFDSHGNTYHNHHNNISDNHHHHATAALPSYLQFDPTTSTLSATHQNNNNNSSSTHTKRYPHFEITNLSINMPKHHHLLLPSQSESQQLVKKFPKSSQLNHRPDQLKSTLANATQINPLSETTRLSSSMYHSTKGAFFNARNLNSSQYSSANHQGYHHANNSNSSNYNNYFNSKTLTKLSQHTSQVHSGSTLEERNTAGTTNSNNLTTSQSFSSLNDLLHRNHVSLNLMKTMSTIDKQASAVAAAAAAAAAQAASSIGDTTTQQSSVMSYTKNFFNLTAAVPKRTQQQQQSQKSSTQQVSAVQSSFNYPYNQALSLCNSVVVDNMAQTSLQLNSAAAAVHDPLRKKRSKKQINQKSSQQLLLSTPDPLQQNAMQNPIENLPAALANINPSKSVTINQPKRKMKHRSSLGHWGGTEHFSIHEASKGFTLKDIESSPESRFPGCTFSSSNTVKLHTPLSSCMPYNPITNEFINPFPDEHPEFYKKLQPRQSRQQQNQQLSQQQQQQLRQSTQFSEEKEMLQAIIDEEFDAIFSTQFKKIMPIRKEDMVYNIKHLAILKFRREKKILEGSQDPADVLDYIKKKNQIQIYLQAAKKITNLQTAAEAIEAQINTQNSRINSIVDELLVKFNITQNP